MDPAIPGNEDVDGNTRIQELIDEIERLQKEIAKLHCTDVKAMDRAFSSLCQHIDALELESRGMSQGISSIETDLVTPECIAEELTTLGLLTGGLVGVHHLIKLTPFNDVKMLYKGFWLAGAAYMLWRLGSGALHRLSAITLNNRRRKRELLNIWAGVNERIQIMHSLASTGPIASHSLPAQPLPSPLPHASHPPAEASSGPAWASPTPSVSRSAAAMERMAHAGALGDKEALLPDL